MAARQQVRMLDAAFKHSEEEKKSVMFYSELKTRDKAFVGMAIGLKMFFFIFEESTGMLIRKQISAAIISTLEI